MHHAFQIVTDMGSVSTTHVNAILVGQEHSVTFPSKMRNIATTQTARYHAERNSHVIQIVDIMVPASTISASVTRVGLGYLVIFSVAQVILSVFLLMSTAVVMVHAAIRVFVSAIGAGLVLIVPIWYVLSIAT
jgi:hypothetical protein